MAGFWQNFRDFLRGDPSRDSHVENPGRRRFVQQVFGGGGAGVFLGAMGPLAPALENFSNLIIEEGTDPPPPPSQASAMDPYYQAILQEYSPRSYARAQFQFSQGGQFSRVFSFVIEGDESGQHSQNVLNVMIRSMPSSTAYTTPSIQITNQASGFFSDERLWDSLGADLIQGKWAMAGFNASFGAEAYHQFPGFSRELNAVIEQLAETNCIGVAAAGNLGQMQPADMPNAGAPGYFGLNVGGSTLAEHQSSPLEPSTWAGSIGQVPSGYVDIIARSHDVPSIYWPMSGTSFAAPQVTAVLMEMVGRYGREIAKAASLEALYGIDYDDIHNPYYAPIIDSLGVDRNRDGWEEELYVWRSQATGRINQILMETLLVSADRVPARNDDMLITKENAPAYDPQGTGYGRLNISRFEHSLQDTIRLYRIRERDHATAMPHIIRDIPEPQLGQNLQGYHPAVQTVTLPDGTQTRAAVHELAPLTQNINPHDIFGNFMISGIPEAEQLTFYLQSPQGTMCPVGMLTDLPNRNRHTHVFDTSGFLREPSMGGWTLIIVPTNPQLDFTNLLLENIAFGARGTAYEQTIFVDPKIALANETLGYDIAALERAVEATPINQDREEHLRLYDQLTVARALHNTYMQGDIPIYDYRDSPPTSRNTFQSILEHVTEQLEVLAEYKRMNGINGADELLVMADTLFAATHHIYAFIHDDGRDATHTQALRHTMNSAITALGAIDREALRDAIGDYGRNLETLFPNDVPGHPDFRQHEAYRIESRILPELDNVLETVLAINPPLQRLYQSAPQRAAERH